MQNLSGGREAACADHDVLPARVSVFPVMVGTLLTSLPLAASR